MGNFALNTANTRKPAEAQNVFSVNSFRASASSPRFRGVDTTLTQYLDELALAPPRRIAVYYKVSNVLSSLTPMMAQVEPVNDEPSGVTQ